FADQGKVTAIVGPSGGGKSTIASLISRFYDVTDGSIQIGGVDIRDILLDALMDKVSFVFQDTFLFKQSILDNIRMGNPDATEEQVIAAAKAARCHDFIEQLPNGYQTVIGSTGVHLSGGERQRIAIARAIVKDAPIIVLDEATAFSDPENEYLIQKAFEKLIQNKTVVMIAHRLSTIRNADQILVMEKGCLIESGTHDELLKKDGKYAQMWSSYTESINWKIGTGKAV
ncbi:MAG: ATP-binding cassette domain-containing protein, partial [[Ruminococcus] gnavus]|nr:ATP-binding cassette domain-containing protein [Mediterraneibacter gnavus]